MKMLGTLKDTVQDINSALGPMGSSKLSAGFDAVDKVENTLQIADSVATGVVRGDVGSMVTASRRPRDPTVLNVHCAEPPKSRFGKMMLWPLPCKVGPSQYEYTDSRKRQVLVAVACYVFAVRQSCAMLRPVRLKPLTAARACRRASTCRSIRSASRPRSA